MNRDDILNALRTVEDPEAGMNIVDLGLIYRVDIQGARVEIDMTMTSPACPVGPYLTEEAAAAVRDIVPAEVDVKVDLVWEPPWTPERMSAEARGRFGWTG